MHSSPKDAPSSRRLEEYRDAVARTVAATAHYPLEQQSASLHTTMLDHLTRTVIQLLDTFEGKTFPSIMVLPVQEYSHEDLQIIMETIGKDMKARRDKYYESTVPDPPPIDVRGNFGGHAKAVHIPGTCKQDGGHHDFGPGGGVACLKCGQCAGELLREWMSTPAQPLRRIKCIDGECTLELMCGHMVWPPPTEEPWKVGDLITCHQCLPMEGAPRNG